MFRKQGVCICTTAGAGAKSALKDMADSLFFWGIAKIYRYGVAVAAANWEGVREKKRKAIDRATTKLAGKLVSRNGKVTPGLKTRVFFFIMRFVQRKGFFSASDAAYWKEKGWTGSTRPW